MLNKKNVWFLTLFSIIIVMTLYYIADPKIKDDLYVNKDAYVPEALSITTNESEAITAMKIDRDATIEKEVNAIKEILTDELKTTEEKSDAYEALKSLNTNKSKEEKIEKLIKETYNYDNFVKIDGIKIKAVIDTKEHSYDLATNIISTIENEFNEKVYVSVTFEA